MTGDALTPEDRESLRTAAIGAQRAIRDRSNIRIDREEHWVLQTSNSYRRIGAHGDGDVLCGANHRIDRQPDLLAPPGVLAYIVAAQPSVVIQLLDDVAALEDKLRKAEIICTKINDVEAHLDQMSDVLVALSAAVRQVADATDPESAARARSLIEQLIMSLWKVRA